MIKFYAIAGRNPIKQLLVTVENQKTVAKTETGKTYKILKEAEIDISALNTIKNLMILNSETL